MVDEMHEWPSVVQAPETLRMSHTVNPYWDRVRTIPGDFYAWKYEHRWQPHGDAFVPESTSYRDGIRFELMRKYSYAIPDPDTIDFVVQHIGRSGIEIGAGTGYWCWQLSQCGVDMLAYDIAPPQLTVNNEYHSSGRRSLCTDGVRDVFYPVHFGDASQLLTTTRVLFLCWPPMTEMAFLCLQMYPGNRLVYIGEYDGCTADEAFFERLDEEWECVAEHTPVQWNDVHDTVEVFERKNA